MQHDLQLTSRRVPTERRSVIDLVGRQPSDHSNNERLLPATVKTRSLRQMLEPVQAGQRQDLRRWSENDQKRQQRERRVRRQ